LHDDHEFGGKNLNPERAVPYLVVKGKQREIQRMRGVAKRIRGGKPLSCTNKTAEGFAGVITTFARSVADAIKPSEDRIPAAEMSDFEKKEEHELQLLWSGLQPVMAALTDTSNLTAALSGNVDVPPAVLKQIAVVLELLASRRHLSPGDSNPEVERVEMVRRTRMRRLAWNPNGLIMLQRYAAMLERSIARRLAEFQKSKARRAG